MSWIDVFELADLLGADRGDEVLRRQRIGDVLARQTAGLQRRRVEIDLHLALLAAEGIRDRRAGHGDQRRAQLVDAEIERAFCSVRPSPDSASCRIGTVDAL